MLRLAWLTIAQHVFQPILTGRLELISRKNCLLQTGNKGSHCEQISPKIVSRELGPRSYHNFSRKISHSWAPKMGSNMQPQYIQFHDIHDRDISGVPCILNRFVSWVQPYFSVHLQLEEYIPITRSWFAVELSQCLDKLADVNSMVKQWQFD